MTNSFPVFRKCFGCAATLDADPLVEDVLTAGGLSVLHSHSNLGKSFFALDLAWHIACGKPWRGRRVTQGAVLYFALDGGSGVHNRVHALQMRSGMPAPFAVASGPLDLLAEADVLRVIKAIKYESRLWQSGEAGGD